MVQAREPADLKTQNGRLRWAREQRHPSARAAAHANGWNENTYKSHEQGIRRGGSLTEDDAKRYARAFGVSVEWIMTGRGGSTATPQIASRLAAALRPSPTAPLLGLVGAGTPIEAIESGDPDRVDVPAGFDNALAFRVRGDSCEPVFDDGDIVVVRDGKPGEGEFVGRYCVVETIDGGGYVKQVVEARPAPGGQGRAYTLRSPNAPDLPLQNIKSARPVVLRIIKGAR